MIKAIIGLGNPGPRFTNTRHNIGFMVVDALAEQQSVSFRSQDNLEHATVQIHGQPVILVKPQTFMNDSGKVLPWLQKKGIAPEDILVVHDELEFPFGKVTHRIGGSARGHNGLRSIITHVGENFQRLRCGISRPDQREQVANYVLERFKEPKAAVDAMIVGAIELIEQQINK